MTHPTPHRAWRLAALLGLAAVAPARADDGRLMPANVPAAYTQECASCHLAYPPGMLPARSWQRLMGGLDRHYGTDASLDAATLQQINGWLQAHAGTYKRVSEAPAQDRITRSAWFERKHRQIDPAVWRLASVRSAANCAACHTGADRGVFDDDHLQFPEGMDARLRRPWND
jgi:mono/diheme cytochrome c family protein